MAKRKAKASAPQAKFSRKLVGIAKASGETKTYASCAAGEDLKEVGEDNSENLHSYFSAKAKEKRQEERAVGEVFEKRKAKESAKRSERKRAAGEDFVISVFILGFTVISVISVDTSVDNIMDKQCGKVDKKWTNHHTCQASLRTHKRRKNAGIREFWAIPRDGRTYSFKSTR